MKVWKAFTLGVWVVVMTTCVALIAVYYILSQTVLSPNTVKKWLNDSGSYGQLAEVVVPMLAASDNKATAKSALVTDEMLQRAAKASLKPEEVKTKVEPIIDATYAWLDSKSPEVTFSVSIDEESERFLDALRREVRARAESLPECDGYIGIAEIEAADCLPWYVSSDAAADTVIARLQQQEIFRDKVLEPESIAAKSTTSVSGRVPELISLIWVVQLIAMPIASLVALFVIVKRRAAGLVAVSTALLLPGLTLLVIGLLFQLGGHAAVSGLVERSDFAALAEPLGKTIARSFTSTLYLVGGVLTGIGTVLAAVGIWWWKRKPKTQSSRAGREALPEK